MLTNYDVARQKVMEKNEKVVVTKVVGKSSPGTVNLGRLARNSKLLAWQFQFLGKKQNKTKPKTEIQKLRQNFQLNESDMWALLSLHVMKNNSQLLREIESV